MEDRMKDFFKRYEGDNYEAFVTVLEHTRGQYGATIQISGRDAHVLLDCLSGDLKDLADRIEHDSVVHHSEGDTP